MSDNKQAVTDAGKHFFCRACSCKAMSVSEWGYCPHCESFKQEVIAREQLRAQNCAPTRKSVPRAHTQAGKRAAGAFCLSFPVDSGFEDIGGIGYSEADWADACNPNEGSK